MAETAKIHDRAGAAAAALGLLAAFGAGGSLAQGTPPNACPVDGCEVRIVDVKKSGNELALTLQANFTPDMSKNHVHVWWGDNFTVKQVSNNAETAYGVKLDAAGLPYQARVLVGPVAETIVEHAKRTRCELIYIGTRGMNALGKALLGSTAAKVLHISDVPVLLVK